METSPLEQLLAEHGAVAPDGASEAEVLALESQLRTRLPRDYRAFLRWMGRDKGGIWRGTACFVDDIVDITRALPELLADNGFAHRLSPKYVCVLMHQGYIAVWFELPTDADDPAALVFNEGRPELGIQSGRSVMQTFLDDHRALRAL